MNLDFCIIKERRIYTLVTPEEAKEHALMTTVCSVCELYHECVETGGNLCKLHGAEEREYYIMVGMVEPSLDASNPPKIRLGI